MHKYVEKHKTYVEMAEKSKDTIYRETVVNMLSQLARRPGGETGSIEVKTEWTRENRVAADTSSQNNLQISVNSDFPIIEKMSEVINASPSDPRRAAFSLINDNKLVYSSSAKVTPFEELFHGAALVHEATHINTPADGNNAHGKQFRRRHEEIISSIERFTSGSLLAKAARNLSALQRIHELEGLEKRRLETDGFRTVYASPEEKREMCSKAQKYAKAVGSLPQELREVLRV